jgi:hypothetical protein
MSSDQQPAVIGDDTLVGRGTSILTGGVSGETVMMSVKSGRYFGLDDIGSAIWQRLEAPCRFGDLVDQLAADYDADRATIVDDVRPLLAEMAAHGLVKLG